MDINNFMELLSSLEKYYIILIVVVGLIGNSISFILFASTKLRLKEVHSMLAALALVDNGFLLALLFHNINFFNQNLIQKNDIICKLSVYLPYVLSFLSIWLVVLFSIERFIVVFFPLKRHQLCSPRRNAGSIVVLALFSIIFYSYGYWTAGLMKYKDSTFCLPKEDWMDLLKIMTVFDTALTMFLPFSIILLINLSICFKLSQIRRSSIQIKHSNFNTNQFSSFKSQNSTTLVKNDNSSFHSNDSSSQRNNSKIKESKSFSNDLSNNQQQLFRSTIFINERANSTQTISKIQKKQHHSNSNMLLVPRKNDFKLQSRSSNSSNKHSNNSNELKKTNNKLCFNICLPFCEFKKNKLRKRYSKTTRILLAISTTFIILHGPTALLKLWYIFKSLILNDINNDISNQHEAQIFSQSHEVNNHSVHLRLNTTGASPAVTTVSSSLETYPVEELIEKITCNVYYLHYSLNFFLYVFNMKKFQQYILKLFK